MQGQFALFRLHGGCHSWRAILTPTCKRLQSFPPDKVSYKLESSVDFCCLYTQPTADTDDHILSMAQVRRKRTCCNKTRCGTICTKAKSWKINHYNVCCQVALTELSCVMHVFSQVVSILCGVHKDSHKMYAFSFTLLHQNFSQFWWCEKHSNNQGEKRLTLSLHFSLHQLGRCVSWLLPVQLGTHSRLAKRLLFRRQKYKTTGSSWHLADSHFRNRVASS